MEEIIELYAKLEKNNLEKHAFFKLQNFEEATMIRETEKRLAEEIAQKIVQHKTTGKCLNLYLDKGLSRKDGITIRSYSNFIFFLKNFELPDSISFNDELREEEQEGDNSTYDCARFLVLHCIENRLPLPRFQVNILPPHKINLLLNNFLNRNQPS